MSIVSDSVSVIDSPTSDPSTREVKIAPSFPDLGGNASNASHAAIDSDSKPERSMRRRWRVLTKQEWAQPIVRGPYHEYVHQLVEAGWENLRDLDNYMSAGQRPGPSRPLVISVLDISDDSQLKVWPVISDENELSRFMKEETRDGVKIRLYMAEYPDAPRASTIEAFGKSFKLDPRFFKLAINSPGHVFTPAQRHRAPFISIPFGVLNEATASRTDAEKFSVLVYIQPDENGSGWTGIIFFNSQTKINTSPRIVTDPPLFQSDLPAPTDHKSRTFRELYIQSLSFSDITKLAASPFFAISNLLLINYYCWNEIISRIREEDHRVGGISDTSVGHTEDIKKSLGVVQRSGSLGWNGNDSPQAVDIKKRLEEDFKHLVNETDLLWKNRDNLSQIRQQKSEARWNTLTNAFTYLFAPVTIMSGIYGMNVSQISGTDSNPNIWQFFVAVAVMNVVVLLSLAISNFIHTMRKHGRKAGVKEMLGSAFGSVNTK